jgi:hypothetical protein
MSLSKIQSLLKAPKGQFNKFGNYKYRSCEDILEAAKPVLAEFAMYITLSDEIVCVSDRVYVKATATLCRDDGKIAAQTTAYAREALTKKGMDESQITGSSSSYARKYALNGLLAIDDTKDADTLDNTGKYEYTPKYTPQHKEVFDELVEADDCLGLYSMIRIVGDEIYTDLFNSGENGMKTALKNKCRKMENSGKELFDNIEKAISENDSFLAVETMEGLTEKGRSLIRRAIGKESYDSLAELTGTNEST